MLGKEAGLFVASGTQGNLVSVLAQAQRGDEIIVGDMCHIFNSEAGGVSVLGSVVMYPVKTDRHGVIAADLIHAAVKPRDYHKPPTKLLCIENTHNAAGGTAWDLDLLSAVSSEASDLGLKRHMDGARLWNASAASGVDEATFADRVDTVSVCFSKGLGAPVGSALVGPSDFIAEARRFKQMFGGGFRQAGVIAAGAQYALDNNRDRLADDHSNARAFAEAIADAKGARVDLEAVQTNIVFFEVSDPGSVVDAALGEGVAMLADGNLVRAVFHMDVSAADTAKAIDIVATIIDRQ